MAIKNNHDLIPLLDVEEINGRMYGFMKNGSVVRYLELDGINQDSLTDEKFTEITHVLSLAFSQIPNQALDIQFTYKKEAYTDIPVVTSLDMPPWLVEKNRYVREELVKNNEVYKNKIIVAVIAHPSNKDEGIFDNIKKLYKEFKNAIKNTETNLDIEERFETHSLAERIRRVDIAMQTITDSFRTLKMNFSIYNDRQGIFDIYLPFLKPEQSKFSKTAPISVGTPNPKEILVSGTETQEMSKYLIHDQTFIKGYSLDYISMDHFVSQHSIKNLIECPFEFFLTVTIRRLEYNQAREKISHNITLRRMENDIENNGKTISNTDVEKELQEAEEINQKFTNEGSEGLSYMASFFVMKNMHLVEAEMERKYLSMDEYMYELDQQIYMNHFSRFARSAWLPLRGPWESYVKNLPGFVNIDSFSAKKGMEFPDGIAYLLPIYDNKRNDIEYLGTNHFFTESKTLVPYSNFDPMLDSWNQIVTGDMGKGKSVFLNNQIGIFDSFASLSGKNALVRILDFGGSVSGSYYKICDVKNGVHLGFSDPKKPRIDLMGVAPQERIPNKKRMAELSEIFGKELKLSPEDSEIYVITYYEKVFKYEGVPSINDRLDLLENIFSKPREVLEYLIKELELNPGECVPNLESKNRICKSLEIIFGNEQQPLLGCREVISMWVNEVFELFNDRSPKLIDLYQYMHNNGADTSMLIKLKNFTRLGDYKMFDCDSDVDFTNDFIVFDVSGLDDHPKLQKIYTMLVLDLIKNDMYKKFDRARLFIGDEMAIILKNEDVVDFVEVFSRTARKYKFSMILASQYPTDFFVANPEKGKVITGLATRHIYCGFNKAQIIRETIALYELNPDLYNVMKELGVKVNFNGGPIKSYARFLMISSMKNGEEIMVGRNILSPTEYCLYSSSADDNAIFRYYHKNLKEDAYSVIEKMASKQYVGDKGLIEFLIKGNFLGALKSARG